jgi:hypothetical protein
MAWIPSHQELREHPKARRAARMAGVTLPTMIGHLHMLWWWALDHAPDGDCSKYEGEDLADAAMWDGDATVFVRALTDCGPGGSAGFLDQSFRLHDWDQYGGRYGKRVAAGKKAAAARWHPEGTTQPHPEQCERNANASATAQQPDDDRNTEERRGEERRRETPTTSDVPSDTVSVEARKLTESFVAAVKSNGHSVPSRGPSRDKWLLEMDRLLRIGPPGEGGHVPSADEVERVIAWCAADTGSGSYPGESVTVRSVPKFRSRYSELRAKALNGHRQMPAVRDGPDRLVGTEWTTGTF